MIESCARAEGLENVGPKERGLVRAVMRAHFGDASAAIADCAMKNCDGITLKELENRIIPQKHAPVLRRAMAGMIQHGLLVGARPHCDDANPKAPKEKARYKVVTRLVTERLRYTRMLEAAGRKWSADESSVLRYLVDKGRATTQAVLDGVLFKATYKDEDGEAVFEPSAERSGAALGRLVDRGAATRCEAFFPAEKAPGSSEEEQLMMSRQERQKQERERRGADGSTSIFESEETSPDVAAEKSRFLKRALEAELESIRTAESGDTTTKHNKRKRDLEPVQIGLWRARLAPLRVVLVHESCEALVEQKLNFIAKEIVSALLSLGAYRPEPRIRAKFMGGDSTQQDESGVVDCAVSVRQLTAELSRRQRDSSKLTEYLERLQYDSVGFVKKVSAGSRRFSSMQRGSASGGGSGRSEDTFLFDMPTVVDHIRNTTLHAVLVERYGSEAARVHRVLSQHKYLEQADLAEKSLLPPKDARERLYKLFTDDLVTFVEISPGAKSTDRNSLYLWSVNLERSYRRVLADTQFAITNLLIRRAEEVDKSNFDVQVLDDDEAECHNNMTHADGLKLDRFKQAIDIIDHSILRLDQTCAVFERMAP